MGRAWMLVGVLLAACGPGVQRQVTGECRWPAWADDGSIQVRWGCDEGVATVLGRDGSGAWAVVDRASVAQWANSFTVGAPAGSYLLSIQYAGAGYPIAFETSAARVSLAWDVAGRSDSRKARLPTPVAFQVSGLEPWQTTDVLELTSSQAATFAELAAPELPAVLGAGDTSGSATLDWRGKGWLPEGSRGDVVYLHQASTRPLPGTGQTYRTATRAARLPATFTVADGVGQTAPVQLEAVPQTGRFSADWRLSAFEARRAEVNPAATSVRHELLIDARPHRLPDGPLLWGGTPDLAWARLPAGTPDQPLVEVPYGQFLPGLWQEYRMLRSVAALQATAGGATSPATLMGTIARCDPLPAAPGALLPMMTPARAPRLDGRDAFAEPAPVPLDAVLAWSAPEVGTPDGYQVTVARLELGAGGATTQVVTGVVYTAATSLRLPPGMLRSGNRYALWLHAFAGRPAWTSAPYGATCPSSSASLVFTFST